MAHIKPIEFREPLSTNGGDNPEPSPNYREGATTIESTAIIEKW